MNAFAGMDSDAVIVVLGLLEWTEDEYAARGDPVHQVGGIVLTKQAHPKMALRGLKQQDILHQQSASGVGEIA